MCPEKSIQILIGVLVILSTTASIDPLGETISPKQTISFPHCEASVGAHPVTYKDPQVVLEIPETLNDTRKCFLRFQSLFQCPHPYSLQVIEDDPVKCSYNTNNCLLHQRIYWTRGGVLDLEVTVTVPRNIRLLLHVVRLDCDKKLKESVQGLSNDVTISTPVTDKLKVFINAAAEPADTNHISSELDMNAPERDNFLLVPQEPSTFFLSSPGFPRNPTGPSDCFYHIPPTNFRTCRLRISFQFFNLPDPDPNTCQWHYLVVDNKRICGCKSGILYLTQMDRGAKVIRYVNRLTPWQYRNQQQSMGFLLEVQREGCPWRYMAQDAVSRLGREPLSSGFYQNQPGPRKCSFTFADWMRTIANPLWTNRRPQCLVTA